MRGGANIGDFGGAPNWNESWALGTERDGGNIGDLGGAPSWKESWALGTESDGAGSSYSEGHGRSNDVFTGDLIS